MTATTAGTEGRQRDTLLSQPVLGPMRKALDEVGAGGKEARPVGDAHADVIHLGTDQVFAVARGVEPHRQRTLGRGAVSPGDVLRDSDHALMIDVAALVAGRWRAAIRPEVIEIASPRHVLSVVESLSRANRIFLEFRKA